MKTPEFDSPKQAGGVETIGSPNNDLAIVARSRIAWPAWSLIIFCTLLMLALAVWIVSLTWDLIFAFDRRDLEVAINNVSLCLMMFLYLGVILFGAVRMRQLKQYRLAVATAVMAALLLPVGAGVLGVWALVALLKRDVRSQFPRPRRPQSPDIRDDYDDFYGDRSAHARERVKLPAMLMAAGAGVNIFVCQLLLVWGVDLLAAGVLGIDTPMPHSGTAEGMSVGTTLLIVGTVGITTMSVIVIGAGRMRHLRSYRWVMATAILGICSVVLVYLSVLVAPFAIWALVALLSPAVKEEFRQSKISVSDNDA
ncbi:hypothetical protein [Zavarzinella formosa]|uniref:hypothetical protein n=1 Tax=Zavarzinella formosa TaxID=360055 RepID=UPI000366419E|nr:hypothetical protein [Zavarzinella formosa]